MKINKLKIIIIMKDWILKVFKIFAQNILLIIIVLEKINYKKL